MRAAVRLELLDLYGNHQATLKGVSNIGALYGATGISYVPRGAIVSAQGALKFRLPMAVRRNIPIGVDTAVRVVHADWGDEGTFIVSNKSETLAEGGHFADFDCPDQTEELRWAMASVESAKYLDATVQQWIVNEGTSSLANRVLAWQQETPWHASVSSEVDGFERSPFSIYNLTPLEGIGQLCSQRRASWRQGANRHIEMGRFGLVSSGVRLNQYSRRPDRMRNPKIVGINAITPDEDGGALITAIVPKAAGSGDVQISLRDACTRLAFIPDPSHASLGWQIGYTVKPSPVSPNPPYWSGYDPAYPVYRRYVGVTTAPDGWEYFLFDPAANTYRQRWFPYVAQNLTPVTGAPLDVEAVAQSLYVAALQYLVEHNAPLRSFSVETNGHCDVRGIGGQTVRVNIKSSHDGLDSLAVNADYQVVSVERAIDDNTGASTLKWTVSNTGRRVEDNNSVMVGLLQDVSNMQLNPVIFPSRMWLNYMDDIDLTNPTSFVVPGDRSINARVQALLTINALPMRSTVLTTMSGEHSHSFVVPQLVVDIPALTISVSGGDHNNGYVGSTGHSDHTIAPGAHTNSVTSGNTGLLIVATPLFIDPKSTTSGSAVKTAAYGKNGETVVTDVQAWTQTSNQAHTHGIQSGSKTGGATYSVDPSAGIGGSFNILTGQSGALSMGQTIARSTTTLQSGQLLTGTGGSHNHEAVYGIYLNKVNGALVIADFISAWLDDGTNPANYVLFNARTNGTNPATGQSYPTTYTVDLADRVNDQRDHTVYITSTTGRVQVMMNVRQREATIGVGITG